MIKVALVEDELKEQEKIRDYFQKFEEDFGLKFSLTFFKNGKSFLFDFKYGIFDLILMDIDLKTNQNGIDISFELRKIDPDVLIVFVTNLAQYAINGYQVKAFDYIVKPISYYAFSEKMKIISRNIESKIKEKVLIQTDGMRVVVAIKDIYYVEVLNHKLIYHTSKGIFATYGSLRDVQAELSKYSFSLCNSYLSINLEYVERIDGFNVYVKGECLPISHPKRKKFLQDLSLYLGQ